MSGDKDLKLMVTLSPHMHSSETVSQAMRDVVIALLPITIAAIYWYRLYALLLIGVCLLTAVITEISLRVAAKKEIRLGDGSALVTGLLVALCFSPTTPWWIVMLATFLAVGVAKELMGGLGWNRFNPALFGRVMIILFSPVFSFINVEFSALRVDLGSIDVLTQATPLAMLQQGMVMPSYFSMFLGFPGGALGETSAVAILLGGAYLLYKKHISWRIPTAILGTVLVLSVATGGHPVYHMLSGGLMLGAFFMATDWVTSPITARGKIVFGVLIGVLVVVFRIVMAPTEGVAFSILFMNAFVPLIERFTRRPFFGEQKLVSPSWYTRLPWRKGHFDVRKNG